MAYSEEYAKMLHMALAIAANRCHIRSRNNGEHGRVENLDLRTWRDASLIIAWEGGDVSAFYIGDDVPIDIIQEGKS